MHCIACGLSTTLARAGYGRYTACVTSQRAAHTHWCGTADPAPRMYAWMRLAAWEGSGMLMHRLCRHTAADPLPCIFCVGRCRVSCCLWLRPLARNSHRHTLHRLAPCTPDSDS
eukprot:364441-Chlamydomonas_euryale.AAC.3